MPTTDPAVRPDDHHGPDGREDARPALPAGPSRRGLLLGAGAVGGGLLGLSLIHI